MEYDKDFERCFLKRTLEIVNQYDGALDATLLVNCLLGLLVMPKETPLKNIPKDSIDKLAIWGIDPKSIQSFSKCECKDFSNKTIRDLVWRLRNSVAHFQIEPRHEAGKVTAFSFSDRNGFRAIISLAELKKFVVRLASHLEKQREK